MRAEILPTMWPRYRVSGYERVFHYCLMTVMRRAMIYAATSHTSRADAGDNGGVFGGTLGFWKSLV